MKTELTREKKKLELNKVEDEWVTRDLRGLIQ